jgi:hypothetical protein
VTRWVLANPLAIEIDDEGTVWHAGRCVDMLALGQGTIAVATDTGGVWSIDGAYNASCVTDWFPQIDMECLAFGPLRNHILAGARGGLLETDPAQTNLAPHARTFVWRAVNMPPNVKTIHRITVTQSLGRAQGRRIVVATDAGVWWAPISKTGTYSWTQALKLPSDDYYSVATTSAGVVAGVGFPSMGGSGIAIGTWQGGNLVFAPISYNVIIGRRFFGVDVSKMRQVSVASCADDLTRVYAVAADGSGQLLYLLRSDDGGQTWSRLPHTFESKFHGKDTFIKFFGDAGAGGWHKTISVHPNDPEVVAFSWLRAAISSNGGNTWTPIGGDWNPANNLCEYAKDAAGLHEDTHAVYFDNTYTRDRIYVLSDGGIAEHADWHDVTGGRFKSAPNRNLANLQFLSPTGSRGFWGTLGVAGFATISGGGLQDNGNVWSLINLGAAPQPWRKIQGGDGGRVAFLDGNEDCLLARTNDQTDGDPSVAASWNSGNTTFDGTKTPWIVTVTGGVDPDGLKEAIAERVPEPRWQRAGTHILYAVGAGKVNAATILNPVPAALEGQTIENRVIFGLYGNNINADLHWEKMGNLPGTAATITAIGPDRRGDSVFVGTNDGRIFNLEAKTHSVLELGVETPRDGKGKITMIVSHEGIGHFALMDTGAGSVVLRLESLLFKVLAGPEPPPFEPLYALDINRGPGNMNLAIATDSEVWMSTTAGDSWFVAKAGLPARPHCSDLKFGVWSNRSVLLLSTYGRSVWITDVQDL